MARLSNDLHAIIQIDIRASFGTGHKRHGKFGLDESKLEERRGGGEVPTRVCLFQFFKLVSASLFQVVSSQ